MDTPDFSKNPEVAAAVTLVQQLESSAAQFVIKTDDQYQASAAELQRIKGAQKQLEALRTGITGPMNAALKAVNDFFRGPQAKLDDAERTIKRAAAAYATEQERKRREEQAKLEEQARKERERLAAQAQKAAEAGKVEKAAQLEERAATVVAPTVVREPPKVAGVSMREVWKFEVTDPALVPREYLLVDEVKIRKVVGALKGETKIPGVRVYSEKQVAAAGAPC